MLKKTMVCVVLLVMVLTASQAQAKQRAGAYRFGKNKETAASNKLSGGVTWYTEIPGFIEFPFENRDMGYSLYYEYHESAGFWQLGATYVPSPENDAVRDVLTPEISLILKDSIYRLGAGALISYVDYGSDTEWTDVYWQLTGGIEIPIGTSFGIDLYAHYIFENWGDFSDSHKGSPGYSVLISFTF